MAVQRARTHQEDGGALGRERHQIQPRQWLPLSAAPGGALLEISERFHCGIGARTRPQSTSFLLMLFMPLSFVSNVWCVRARDSVRQWPPKSWAATTVDGRSP